MRLDWDLRDKKQRKVFSEMLRAEMLPPDWSYVLLLFKTGQNDEPALYSLGVDIETAVRAMEERVKIFKTGKKPSVNWRWTQIAPFDIRIPELLEVFRTVLNDSLPEDWGFIFFSFPLDQLEVSNYIAKAEREDAILFLEETIFRFKNEEENPDIFI